MHLVRLFLTIACLVGAAATAHANRRVALVVGNSAYAYGGALENPVNDAKAVADLLTRMKFDRVQLELDLTSEGLKAALRRFSTLASRADIAVIYYAGHGIEISGQNYLVPVDARLERPEHIDLDAIPLEIVLKQLRGARRLQLIILDACRDNIFRRNLSNTRNIIRGQGLAPVDLDANNVLVAFATKHGATAEDGEGTVHSPFTMALLQHLASPGVDIRKVLGLIRDQVITSTAGQQIPYVYGNLGGDDIALVDAGQIADAPIKQAMLPQAPGGGERAPSSRPAATDLEAKRKADADARQKADAQRLAAEAEAKRKADEQRLAAEAEAKRKSDAEAARKADEQRLAAEADAKRKADVDAKRKAAADAKQNAEEQRIAAAAQAKQKVEAGAKRKADEQRLAAETEAKRKADVEAKRKADEQRLAAEAEAKRQAAIADAKRTAEQQRLADAETKRRAEAEAKQKAEEQRIAAASDARRKGEDQRLAADADAKRKADADAKKKSDEQRFAAEAEAKRQAEADAKRAAEQQRLAAADAKRKADATAKQKGDEQRVAAAAEGKRKADEQRQAVEIEAKRKADIEVARRAEEQRIAADAEAKRRSDAEVKRKADDTLRVAAATEVTREGDVAVLRKAQEQQRAAAEAEVKRKVKVNIEGCLTEEKRTKRAVSPQALETNLIQPVKLQVELLLKQRGYLQVDSEPDGTFGPRTRDAIKRYQRDVAADPTGHLTTCQLQALGAF